MYDIRDRDFPCGCVNEWVYVYRVACTCTPTHQHIKHQIKNNMLDKCPSVRLRISRLHHALLTAQDPYCCVSLLFVFLELELRKSVLIWTMHRWGDRFFHVLPIRVRELIMRVVPDVVEVKLRFDLDMECAKLCCYVTDCWLDAVHRLLLLLLIDAFSGQR